MVVSRDGFILWARSSDPALHTGGYFRTSAGPIEIPAAALARHPDLLVDGRASIEHPRGVWLREPVRETTIFAEHYDFALSLLQLEDAHSRFHDGEDAELDTYDQFVPVERRRDW